MSGFKGNARELVAAAQRGEEWAFTEIFARYNPTVLAYIRRRTGVRVRARIDPDDLLQETFARGFSAIGKFGWRGEGAFLRWLTTIAEHLILNVAQKPDRASLRLEDDVPGSDPTPSALMRREERMERLETALRALSPDHKTAIVLARIERLRVKDIAKRMNRSPEAVQKLLARAILDLRRRMDETGSFSLPDRRIDAKDVGVDI